MLEFSRTIAHHRQRQFSCEFAGHVIVKISKSRLTTAFIVFIALGFLVYFSTRGMFGSPEEQLARMEPAEREFCLTVLSQITASTTKDEVLQLLGNPSRDLGLKTNWWIRLGDRKDRIGVYFDTSKNATQVVLDGGPGRFYYSPNLSKEPENTP